jgi:hypothetical protein
MLVRSPRSPLPSTRARGCTCWLEGSPRPTRWRQRLNRSPRSSAAASRPTAPCRWPLSGAGKLKWLTWLRPPSRTWSAAVRARDCPSFTGPGRCSTTASAGMSTRSQRRSRQPATPFVVVRQLGAGRAHRGGGARRSAPARGRCPAAALGNRPRLRDRLGAGRRGTLASAGQRRRGRREPGWHGRLSSWLSTSRSRLSTLTDAHLSAPDLA